MDNFEEIYFLADIYSRRDLLATRIKAKLLVDRLKADNSLCFLFPDDAGYKRISNVFELEIRGDIENLGGEITGSIVIERGCHGGASKKSLAPSWEENVIKIYPDEIILKRGVNSSQEDTETTFGITANQWVLPYGGRQWDFKGNVMSDFKPRIVLTPKGLALSFVQHFYRKETQIKGTEGSFSYSSQVLRIEGLPKLRTEDELIPIFNMVDDLLWHLSLSTRQRTTWIRCSTIVSNQLIEFIRCNITYPKVDAENDPLIDIGSLGDFLQHCLSSKENNDVNNLNLYLPVIYLSGAANKTAESQFLSLYTSLEALLNIFAENKQQSGHLTGNEWRRFNDHLEKAIDSFIFSKENMGDVIKRKLSRLNEPSLKSFYEDFLKRFNIDNTDLWPIFGKKTDEMTLSKIRNTLTHGRLIEDIDLISVAAEHLQWMVERCLLAALEWDGSSDVDKEKLSKYYAYQNWKAYLQ